MGKSQSATFQTGYEIIITIISIVTPLLRMHPYWCKKADPCGPNALPLPGMEYRMRSIECRNTFANCYIGASSTEKSGNADKSLVIPQGLRLSPFDRIPAKFAPVR